MVWFKCRLKISEWKLERISKVWYVKKVYNNESEMAYKNFLGKGRERFFRDRELFEIKSS